MLEASRVVEATVGPPGSSRDTMLRISSLHGQFAANPSLVASIRCVDLTTGRVLFAPVASVTDGGAQRNLQQVQTASGKTLIADANQQVWRDGAWVLLSAVRIGDFLAMWGGGGGGGVYFEEITASDPAGKGQVYSVSLGAEPRNFVCSNFVVHDL